MSDDSPVPSVGRWLLVMSVAMFLTACLEMRPFNIGTAVLLISAGLFAWAGIGIIRDKSS